MKAKELFPGIFSRHAAAYRRRLDELMSRGEVRARAAIVKWIEPTPGMHALDLGCGPGTLTFKLAKAVAPDGQAVGIDLAPGMLEEAQRATPFGLPVRFELMDMEELRFPDASFDAVTCGHGLQFCPDLDRALREAHRVLREGGRFAASVPVDPLRPGTAHAILDRVAEKRLPPIPKASDQARTREIVQNAELFRKAALAAGFSQARADQIAEETTWRDPAHFVRMATGWWSCASRLERLDAQQQESFVRTATRALEQELGNGPLRVPGLSQVLYATK